MIFFSSPKQPSEDIAVAVDFKDRLVTGETLSAPAATAKRLDTGADVTASLLVNPPAISGSVVSVRVVDGVDGVDYQVTLTVSTSSGRKYEVDVVLPLRDF